MIRAALHLHSTWSDGEFSLSELRTIFERSGCRVIGVVDHAEAFDDGRLSRFRDECCALSDEYLLLLPGLEFECRDRMHIVGYGVTKRVDSDDPQTVIGHIADHGGVSVIAHPKAEFFDRITEFGVLPNGIEAWNSKYDGRQAPRPATFELITSLRERDPGLHAFYGIDLHWRKQYRNLHTLIDADRAEVTRETVLDQLRQGRFVGAAGATRLPSSGVLSAEQSSAFETLHRRGRRLKAAFARAKRLTDSLGLRPPAALKAQLRRLF